ncbi:hypothetical protein GOP47_0028286 [Adiantum capillus-veneris]|nr:hypothetical protein GOP47_0028286 [Adiantum capillus-veneris]
MALLVQKIKLKVRLISLWHHAADFSEKIAKLGGFALFLLACMASTCCVGQLNCDKNRVGLSKQDCLKAINMLTEDAFTLEPGHFMQEVFGSCKACVSNNGCAPKKFYRDTVTLEFDDILVECVHYNAHPGVVLSGNEIFYSLASNHP